MPIYIWDIIFDFMFYSHCVYTSANTKITKIIAVKMISIGANKFLKHRGQIILPANGKARASVNL
ncbi:MAG: hypothetical protein BAJALOKI3v1_940017 [Promethearchaeota archaeon]|nr:MAG: hypothetical protein BAJALOKI3v1_940017 [Candidatus Lokiarchaeota archaeon]